MRFTTDRENLEWLVRWCLNQPNPCITFDRGRELLDFQYTQQMRDFMGGYDGNPEKTTIEGTK